VRYLRQNTAVSEIIGPFVDVSDAVTPETALIGSDMTCAIFFGPQIQISDFLDSSRFVHKKYGYYTLSLTASDTNTTSGIVITLASDSVCLPVWVNYRTLPTNVYDSLFKGNDYLQVDTQYLSGNAIQQTGGHVHAYDDVGNAIATSASIAGLNDISINDITGDGTTVSALQVYGDTSWTTATGFSTHAASDVWNVATRELTAGTRDTEIDSIKTTTDKIQFNANSDVLATLDGETVVLNATQNEYTPATSAAVVDIKTQIGRLSTGVGGLNVLAEGFAKDANEPETNDYTFTQEGDETYHIVEDDGGNINFYYQFDVGGNGVAKAFEWLGYVQSKGDSVDVKYYDWDSSSYKQITILEGDNGTTPIAEIFSVPINATGTGNNLGKVRLRFESTSATAIATDRVLCEKSVVTKSVGYAEGAIWIDTNADNTNTESYVDGTADNPVSTWGAAKTISSDMNITKFEIKNGFSITMDTNCDNFVFNGYGYNFDLGGQQFKNAHIKGANISGTGTSGDGKLHLIGCTVSDCVLGKTNMNDCLFIGTISLSTSDTYTFNDCVAGDSGSAPPIIDFNEKTAAVGLRGYKGGIRLKNMNSGSKFTIQGNGKLIIDSSCSDGGTIGVHGCMTMSDGVAGGFSGTINDDSRMEVSNISTGLWSYDTRTLSANTNLNDPTASDIADAVWDELVSDHTNVDSFGKAISDININNWNWFVDGTNGDNNNTGRNWTESLSTVSAAVSRASNGDIINIAPGTYNENVDASSLSPITFRGAGWTNTKISVDTSDAALQFSSDIALYDIWVDSTNSGSHGYGAVFTNDGGDVFIENCKITGPKRFALNLSNAEKNVIIRKSIILGSEYGVPTFVTDNLLVEDSIFGVSDWTNCLSANFVATINNVGIIRNSLFYAYDGCDSFPVTALGVVGNVLIEDCCIDARNINGSSAFGIVSGEGTTYVKNCAITTSDITGSDSYDLSNESGTLYVCNTSYDRTKTNGTLTEVYPTMEDTIDAIWDELISDHTTASTFGKAISDIDTDTDDLATSAAIAELNDIAASDVTGGVTVSELQTYGASWVTATGFSTHAASDVWNIAIRTLTADTNINYPSSDAIADAVWDEVMSDHITANTTGDYLSDAANVTISISNTDISDIVDGVWDEPMTDHTIAGSTADVLSDAGQTGTSAELIADAVWDELISDHTNIGTTGNAMSDISLLSNDGLADAVWDELVSDHQTTGTFGAYMSDIDTAGHGATPKTYTITDDNNNPIEGVSVWVTTDVSGNNIIASGTTDSNGQVIFYLTSGDTVYIWSRKDGYTFTNPDVEVV